MEVIGVKRDGVAELWHGRTCLEGLTQVEYLLAAAMWPAA